MSNQKISLDTPISFVLFTALFVLIVILLSMGVLNAAPNTNSLLSVALSLFCAVPFGYALFFNPKFVKNTKPYQRIILPVLIFPLCIALLLSSSLYQQRPENLFKLFVMDHIPNGVSNIQGDDISLGFDTEVLLAFDATPEAIDKIIKENGLTLYEENISSHLVTDPPYEYFPDINWSKNWTAYESFSYYEVKSTIMWVNNENHTVIFQFISG